MIAWALKRSSVIAWALRGGVGESRGSEGRFGESLIPVPAPIPILIPMSIPMKYSIYFTEYRLYTLPTKRNRTKVSATARTSSMRKPLAGS